MSAELVSAIIAGAIALILIIAILWSICRGELQKYIVEKMNEAEKKYADLPKPERSKKKLAYVLNAVKEKYRLPELFLNVKKFIEYIVSMTKINK